VYARSQYDGEKSNEINESRYLLLRDQLAVYDREQISWSIWLYKDIGFQGEQVLDARGVNGEYLRP
jgi:hypothetical protein